jgi:hypothetical protein
MRKVIFSVLLFSASTFCFGQTNEPEKKITTDIKVTGSLFTPIEAEEALQYHNKVRADVGAPPVVWSKDLAAHAQVWADYLANNQCQFRHRTSNDTAFVHYGENLYASFIEYFKSKFISESFVDFHKKNLKNFLENDYAKYKLINSPVFSILPTLQLILQLQHGINVLLLVVEIQPRLPL